MFKPSYCPNRALHCQAADWWLQEFLKAELSAIRPLLCQTSFRIWKTDSLFTLKTKIQNVVFDKFKVRAGYGESETPLSYNDVKTKAFHKTI